MAVVEGWMAKVYDELTFGGGPLTSFEADEAIEAIKKHCPFKPDTAYVPVEDDEERTRREIGYRQRIERLEAVLREAKREHGEYCPVANPWYSYNVGVPCDCGADEWNAKIDEALK